MTKWYALDPQGDMVFVGEFETLDEADESLEHSPVWLFDEEASRQCLVQLEEVLK